MVLGLSLSWRHFEQRRQRHPERDGKRLVLRHRGVRGAEFDLGDLLARQPGLVAQARKAQLLSQPEVPDALPYCLREVFIPHGVAMVETAQREVNVSMVEKNRTTRKRAARLGFRAVVPLKKRTGAAAEGAYNLDRIAAEIEEARQRLGWSVKKAADEAGIARTLWYKKRDREDSSFSIEDISVIARVFRAPRGWPLLSWAEAEDFDMWRKGGRGR